MAKIGANVKMAKTKSSVKTFIEGIIEELEGLISVHDAINPR